MEVSYEVTPKGYYTSIKVSETQWFKVELGYEKYTQRKERLCYNRVLWKTRCY